MNYRNKKSPYGLFLVVWNEGVLARRSGLTKSAVSSILDYLDIVDFVAEYDPTELAPQTKKMDKEK